MTVPALDKPDIKALYEEWTSASYDEKTRAELQALAEAGASDELEDRFYRTLEFGTGGLRGKIGAGTNRMNTYIVARATQGLASYIKQHADKPGPHGAVISHDSRHRSREFAETAACVFAANGINVHISPDIRATPWVSFAIRHLNAHTGIMVTASHNPKEYNGYKVYWDDGSQVVPPHDKGIIAEVNKVTNDSMVQRMDFEEGRRKGLIHVLGEEMDKAFLEAVRKQQRRPADTAGSDLKLVFTPLHGVGGLLVPRALEEWGFSHVICEPEQSKPDGDFPTAASPNPEEGAALERAIELARREGADLVLATDPDCDRVGIAALHEGEYRLFNGNEVCALLADYVLENTPAEQLKGKRPGIVSTIVSTPLVKKIADAHGADCALVLTGFKWIAKQMRDWEAEKNGPVFLYGAEESYGYLIGPHCRDKDAVVASCAIAEMAAVERKRGRTLVDRLYALHADHGVHLEWQKSITMPGMQGAEQIRGILEAVRNDPPDRVGDAKVLRFARFDTGEVFEEGKRVGATGLPKSDVFLFDLECGRRAVVRPSGTEPKIKFYFFLGAPAEEGDAAETLGKLRREKSGFQADFLKAIGYAG